MVMCCVSSSLHVLAHKAELNCLPWSYVRIDRPPNLATHVSTKASMQLDILMLQRGTASSNLVDLSTMMNW
jgi:hypothetical protein